MEQKKSSKINLIFMWIFLGIVFAFSIAHILIPDKDFSEEENASLASFPKISSAAEGTPLTQQIQDGKFLDRLWNGKFTSEINTYMSDQFPARNFFIGFHALCENAMLKGQNNDVIFGSDGYLIDREDYPSEETLLKNMNAISAFLDAMEARDIPAVFAAAGRTADVTDSKIPTLYGSEAQDRIWDKLISAAPKAFLNLREPLRSLVSSGEYVYYRTDHHWTTKGAYEAYRIIAAYFGVTPVEESFFKAEIASDAFYGTTWSSAGTKWTDPDVIEYYRYDGDEDYTTELVLSGDVIQGFYDRSYLEVKDQYSSFLSGNVGHIRVTKNNGENRPVMLIIKDSFAHSLAPFLAIHWDLEILDLRYYKVAPADFIKQNPIDAALILYNLDSLTTTASLSILSAGIE